MKLSSTDKLKNPQGSNLNPKSCRVHNCKGSYLANGLCRKHYDRVRKTGSHNAFVPNKTKSCSVSGCSNLRAVKKYCKKHYSRIRLNGTLRPLIAERGAGRDFINQAISSSTDKCILWPFGKTGGYGRIGTWAKGLDGKPVGYAHRYVCMIAHGNPPIDSPFVCHSPVICHEPSCINPRHLRWGNAKDNATDKASDQTTPKGEAHFKAKLSAKDIPSIRSDTRSQPEIARDYGVTRSAIEAVKNNRTWRHVQ